MTELNHKVKNIIHTLALFICMVAILSLVGFMLAGIDGILWAAFLGVLILVISPNLSPSFIFSMYNAKLLSVEEFPDCLLYTSDAADE